MEVGVRLEGSGIELTTARGDGGAEFVERGDVPIDDRLIHQRPEMLGGLEFGRVGRQEDEADPLGDDQTLGSMPAGIVEHENDAALAAGAGLTGEGGEQFGEERLREAAAEIPDRLAAGRLHEGGDVQPLVPMMAERNRSLADGRPDPAADRLQAEAVLVLRPDLDQQVGMRRPGLGDSGIEPPLKAARCSGVAARGCRGRGA
jgi:hypothetical protein